MLSERVVKRAMREDYEDLLGSPASLELCSLCQVDKSSLSLHAPEPEGALPFPKRLALNSQVTMEDKNVCDLKQSWWTSW